MKPTGIRQPKNAGMRTVVRTVRAGKNGVDSRLHFFVFFAEHCVISHGAGERGTFAPAIFKKRSACGFAREVFSFAFVGACEGDEAVFSGSPVYLNCFSVFCVVLVAFRFPGWLCLLFTVPPVVISGALRFSSVILVAFCVFPEWVRLVFAGFFPCEFSGAGGGQPFSR